MMENKIEALEITLRGWLEDTSNSKLRNYQIKSITKELDKLYANISN